MVTFLNAKPGFGSRFSQAFQPAFNQGMNRFLEESALEDREKRKALQEQSKEQRLLGEKKETAKALGLPDAAIEPTVQAALLKEKAKDARNQALLQRLGGGIGQNAGDQEAGGMGNLSDEDVLGIGVENPQIAQLIQKQQQATQGTREFGHKETAKYAEKIVSDAERASEIIDAADEIQKIAKKKGAVGANARNLAFTYLKDKKSPFANLFQNEDTQALISATKTLAGGGIKEIFNRPTEREFFWFENILPDILKDAPTNEKSASYFKKLAKISLKRQEIYDDIVKKNKGYRPIDIDGQVRSKLEPEMKKLVEEGEKLKKDQFTLEALPNPKEYSGKVAEDDEGNRYKSNGILWERI